MEEALVVGKLSAIYFENPTNLYKVIRIEVDAEKTSVLTGAELVCTGQLATLHYDTTYEFYGQFTTHPRYGEQFAISRYQQVEPTTEQGLVDYLSGDRFPGIGVVLAQRIVDTLGMDAIELIIQDTNALKSVKGLTKAKRVSLRENLLKYQGTERVFMQLSEWGFTPKIADKIYQKYKSNTIEEIKNNPYLLVEDIEGISFQRADQLAEQLGFEPDVVERLMAGYFTAITEYCYQNGDTYIQEALCHSQTQQMLEKSRPYLLTQEQLTLALEKAILEKKIMRLADGLMIPSLYYAEIGIAEKLYRQLSFAQIDYFPQEEIDSAIQSVMKTAGIAYDAQQQSALRLAMNSPISIITGGPGTGKTTLVKGLIALHAQLHDYNIEEIQKNADFTPILLAAPTGRAAKRMNEMTDLPAMTIHRMLGFNRESDVENFETSQELDGKLLIVDEMSMVDTWLMNWLIQAVPYQMQIVLVGDQDQLPSVGPGKVFSDLIESQVLPTIRLEKIYRQGQDSTIVQLAHAIRGGQLPEDFLQKQADRSFIQCQPNQVVNVVQQIVERAQEKDFNATNLQVLAPMYKGAAGINQLNAQLQAIMNPPHRTKRELKHFEQVYRVDDKVLQLVNNAEADVYNGDIGKIIGIFDKEETESGAEELLVAFDEKELVYKRGDLDQLTLAYCCSIHKSQGSEYPLVILPLVDLYSRMLRKDLLYTAITRAKQSLVMVGNPNSFFKAATSTVIPRATFLKDLLQLKLKERQYAQITSVSEQPPELEEDSTIDPIKEILTEETMWEIDPMIGMDGITPYDFMEA